MNTCPTCTETTGQHRAGTNPSGTQRYECQHCHRTYTPQPKEHGCAPAVRKMALRMYVEGGNFRRIGRLLGVHHQSVVNWVDAAAARLPAPPTPRERLLGEAEADTLELDGVYTFIGEKKTAPTS
jgi:transposase-like protein